MSEALEIIKSETDVKKLAGWWCELNSFILPEELKSPNQELSEAKQLMFEIMDKISYKECIREWNVSYKQNELKMTNEQFESWWTTRKPVDDKGCLILSESQKQILMDINDSVVKH